VLLTAAICLLALVGTDWFSSKLLTLDAAYGHLPRWIHNVPRSVRAGGFHPNEVGGTLSMLIPIMLAATVASRYREARPLRAASLWDRAQTWTIATALVLAIALLSLILTQSRGAIVATAIALIPLALGLRRRFLLLALLPISAIILWAGGQMVRTTRTTGTVSPATPPPALTASPSAWLISLDRSTAGGAQRSSSTWGARLEIWGNAWEHLWDYPFTGSGLATFTAVSKANYPYDKVDPRFPITHAHNLYLQVGADFGWFGLIAFMAMCVLFFFLAGYAYRHRSSPRDRWYVRGLAAGIVGYLAFGFLDAITLGSKPSIIFWLALGGIAATAVDWGRSSAWGGRVRRTGGGLFLLALLFVALTLLDAEPARANRGALRLDRVLLAENLQPGTQEAMTRQALADLSGAWALPGARQGIWRRIGQSRLLLGDETQALAAWQHDARAYPFLLWKGRVAEVQDDWPEATHDYAMAARLRPEASRAFYRRGRVLQAQGQTAAAQRAYQKALTLNDFDRNVAERADTYRRLGQILAGQDAWGAAQEAFQESVALEPDAPTLLALGWSVYRATGDVATAQSDFRRAVALDPDNLWVALRTGRAWLYEGQTEASAVWADYLQNAFPQSAWGSILAGQIALQTHDAEGASAALHHAADLEPQNGEAHLWLSVLYASQGKMDAAQQEAERAIALGEASSSTPLFLQLGEAALQNEDFERAGQSFRQVLEHDPANSRALWGLARTLRKMGDNAGTAPVLDRLVVVSPDFQQAWNLRGYVALENKDYRTAADSFQHLVMLSPANAPAYYALARARRKAGDLAGAAQAADQALALAPDYRAVWMLRAQIALAQQDAATAAESYQKAIDLGPATAQLYYSLATALRDAGDLSGSALATDKALALAPDWVDVWLLRGQIAMEEGELTRARESFQQVVDLAPTRAEGHYWLGRVYGVQSQWDLAIQEANQATALNPNMRFAWLLLGDSYRNVGQVDQAIEAYGQMLKLNPDDQIAQTRLRELSTK